MAASALGLPSGTRLAAAVDRVCCSSSSSSPSSSSFSPSSSLASPPSSPFSASSCRAFSEARRGPFRVSSLSPRAGTTWARHKHSRVRSFNFQEDTGVAEPSSSSAEASLSSASLSTSSSSSSSLAEATLETGPPTIDLEFLGPEQGQDASLIVDKVSVTSGEKLLRTVMNEQKFELYGLYGKIMNCGGGGSCGTCIVEILEGSDLLNERTDAEGRYLKKNPSTWRLACQTIVGDKSNSGKVVVQRLPQKKQ